MVYTPLHITGLYLPAPEQEGEIKAKQDPARI